MRVESGSYPLLREIFRSVARKFLGELYAKTNRVSKERAWGWAWGWARGGTHLVREGDIVRLELLLVGRVAVGQHDHREGLAGGGEGVVVDAGDAGAEG